MLYFVSPSKSRISHAFRQQVRRATWMRMLPNQNGAKFCRNLRPTYRPTRCQRYCGGSWGNMWNTTREHKWNVAEIHGGWLRRSRWGLECREGNGRDVCDGSHGVGGHGVLTSVRFWYVMKINALIIYHELHSWVNQTGIFLQFFTRRSQLLLKI